MYIFIISMLIFFLCVMIVVYLLSVKRWSRRERVLDENIMFLEKVCEDILSESGIYEGDLLNVADKTLDERIFRVACYLDVMNDNK